MPYGELVETEYVGSPPVKPGLALALVLSVLLTPVVARRLRIARIHAWLLLISLGVILALTLTPSRAAVELGVQGTIGCDLSRIGPGSWSTYARIDDPILNVLVFIPLGISIGLLPPSRTRRWLFVGAFLLPVAIETTQALVVALDRACQGGDVFDNLAGLVIGLALGLGGGLLWRWARRRLS
jgi:glycopeptide antibiotics resistance protein